MFVFTNIFCHPFLESYKIKVWRRYIFIYLFICLSTSRIYCAIQKFECHHWHLKIHSGGFPGGAVVENLPANAGDTGSSPGLGRSHMPRSGWAREPHLLSLRVWSLCSATREAAIVRGPRTAMKSGARLPQLEKALAQKRRPNTAINKLKKKKKIKKKVYYIKKYIQKIYLNKLSQHIYFFPNIKFY